MPMPATEPYFNKLVKKGGRHMWHVLEGALQNQDPHIWAGGNGKVENLSQALAAINTALDETVPEQKASKNIFPRLAGSIHTIETINLEEELSLNAWLFLNSPYQYHWFCAGVGVGKSWLLARYILRRVMNNPETVGLYAANTHTQLAQSSLPHLFELFEEAGLEYLVNTKPPESWGADPKFKAGYKHTISVLIEPGKVAHILTRTLTGWKRIRGVNIGWFCIDEVSDSPAGAFTEMKRRLRCTKSHKLQGLVAGIPDLPGDNWTWGEFNPTDPDAKPFFRVTFQASTEAKHLHPLWDTYLYPMLMTSDPLQALQEIFARIVIDQTGRIYYAYTDGINNESKYEYDPDRPVYFTQDFNIMSSAPSSAVLLQLFDSGKGYWEAQVFDEIIIPHGDTERVCREFLSRYGNHRSEVHFYGDASGAHSQTITEYDVAAKVLHPVFGDRLTMPKITSNPLISERVASVNAMLRNALGIARLFISSKCKELLLDLRKLMPAPGKEGQIDKSDNARSHTSDALGYLLRFLFPPFEKAKKKRSLKAQV